MVLGAGEILVEVEPSDGWAAAEEAGYVVLLDLAVTPELAAEGTARELVRRLQELRRDADLDVADRIEVRYRAPDIVARVFGQHGHWIAEETLALSIGPLTDEMDLSSTGSTGGSPTLSSATVSGSIWVPEATRTVRVEGEDVILALARVS